MKVLVVISALILSSCVEQIAISGRYADYIIRPKHVLIITPTK